MASWHPAACTMAARLRVWPSRTHVQGAVSAGAGSGVPVGWRGVQIHTGEGTHAQVTAVSRASSERVQKSLSAVRHPHLYAPWARGNLEHTVQAAYAYARPGIHPGGGWRRPPQCCCRADPATADTGREKGSGAADADTRSTGCGAASAGPCPGTARAARREAYADDQQQEVLTASPSTRSSRPLQEQFS